MCHDFSGVRDILHARLVIDGWRSVFFVLSGRRAESGAWLSLFTRIQRLQWACTCSGCTWQQQAIYHNYCI